MLLKPDHKKAEAIVSAFTKACFLTRFAAVNANVGRASSSRVPAYSSLTPVLDRWRRPTKETNMMFLCRDLLWHSTKLNVEFKAPAEWWKRKYSAIKLYCTRPWKPPTNMFYLHYCSCEWFLFYRVQKQPKSPKINYSGSWSLPACPIN